MDKASIVKDAINYIYNLQKQVNEIESDISDLKSQKEEGKTRSRHQPSDDRNLDAILCYQKPKVKQEHWIKEVHLLCPYVLFVNDRFYFLLIHSYCCFIP